MRLFSILALSACLAVAGAGPAGSAPGGEKYPDLMGGPADPPAKAAPSRPKPVSSPQSRPRQDATPPRQIGKSPRVIGKPRRKPRRIVLPRTRAPQSPAKSVKRPMPAPKQRPRACASTWRTVTEKVMVAPERVVHRVRPARYRTVERRILVRPGGSRVVVRPARYRLVRERIPVARGGERTVAATQGRHREEYRRVPITGPRRGLVHKRVGKRVAWVPVTLPPATGFRWVATGPSARDHAAAHRPQRQVVRTRRVLVRPERRERVTVEAEYRTVRRKVLVAPRKVERVIIPARYETVSRKVAVPDRSPGCLRQ